MTLIIPVPINQSDFRVSLIDPNGNAAITSNTDCSQLTINDTSNYTTNTESGHAASDFSDFRRILIEHYKGTIINMSSIFDGDVQIQPASTGIVAFNQAVTSGDGRYDITLRSVPSWNASANYQITDDCVYVPNATPTPGRFYQALTNNTGQDPTVSPTDWKEITEDDLPVKYSTKLFIYLDCALIKCMADATSKAFCSQKDAFCDDNYLCENECFMKATKLLLLYYTVQVSVQNQNAQQVDDIADMVAKLCNCDCGC